MFATSFLIVALSYRRTKHFSVTRLRYGQFLYKRERAVKRDLTYCFTAIRVLRVKLDKYADCIRTVRGVGYKYVGPPKEDKQLPTSQPNTSNPPPFDAESGVKKEAERKTQIASHSSQHGAMNGSPHTSNGTSVSISIEAAIKRARISISTFEVSQGRSPVGVAVEPLIRDIIDGFIDDLYSDILGISARVWREYAVDQKAQAILMAYVHELNIIRDLTL